MLTFAERYFVRRMENFFSDIDIPGTECHTAFAGENSLLEHKRLWFQRISFPLCCWANTEWKLVGPFNNNGKTSRHLPRNKNHSLMVQLKNYPSNFLAALSGCVISWHRWFNHYKTRKTALHGMPSRKIWVMRLSKKFWIGFNNLPVHPYWFSTIWRMG